MKLKFSCKWIKLKASSYIVMCYKKNFAKTSRAIQCSKPKNEKHDKKNLTNLTSFTILMAGKSKKRRNMGHFPFTVKSNISFAWALWRGSPREKSSTSSHNNNTV